MEQLLLTIIGFSAGFIVAGGEVALMVGLGILTRFIGISHTARHTSCYEDAILLGAVGGTLVTVFDPGLPGGQTLLSFFAMHFPAGVCFLCLAGLFMGIFVGGWIMALAEVINVFPVYCRRLGIVKGLSWIIIMIAAGKVIGSLNFFYLRW